MNDIREQIDILKEALSEAQQTVRSYDTKAQIVGVGYIFALGIVFKISDLLPDLETVEPMFIVIGWAIVILPILLFGFVLYPTRKSINTRDQGRAANKHLLYFSPGQFTSVADYLDSLQHADGVVERANELHSVTSLRELKRKRFLRALFSSGVAFVLLFAAQLYRSATVV